MLTVATCGKKVTTEQNQLVIHNKKKTRQAKQNEHKQKPLNTAQLNAAQLNPIEFQPKQQT